LVEIKKAPDFYFYHFAALALVTATKATSKATKGMDFFLPASKALLVLISKNKSAPFLFGPYSIVFSYGRFLENDVINTY
jgi:hypothetical protein